MFLRVQVRRTAESLVCSTAAVREMARDDPPTRRVIAATRRECIGATCTRRGRGRYEL